MEIELLIAVNAVGYGSLLAGSVVLLRERRSPRPKAPALEALTDALRARFPDLPPGFTLREGVGRARHLKLDIDWQEVDRSVSAYEGHRFGSSQPSPYPGLGELAEALRRSS